MKTTLIQPFKMVVVPKDQTTMFHFQKQKEYSHVESCSRVFQGFVLQFGEFTQYIFVK